jgi:hypothetical protein
LKIFLWVMKNFWFPILVAILGLFSSKYPWAQKIHTALKNVK